MTEKIPTNTAGAPNQASGQIVKATGGFYYVQIASGQVVECRGRGIFRKQGQSPCVGDWVTIQIDGDNSGTVDKIGERKNLLLRPPLANLDYMVVVLSVTDPLPNLFVTDKFLAVLEHKDIPPIIAITKSDLGCPHELARLYRHVGYPVHIVNPMTGEGMEDFRAALASKLCAFSGNSGVGKSSLLNALAPHFALETGGISKKLGRGRHTTRHVELFELDNHALIADTPGFSSVEIGKLSTITKESLPWCFHDMEPYLGQCKYVDCSHTAEQGCAVLAALANRDIEPTRHEAYRMLYDEIKDLKEWDKPSR